MNNVHGMVHNKEVDDLAHHHPQFWCLICWPCSGDGSRTSRYNNNHTKEAYIAKWVTKKCMRLFSMCIIPCECRDDLHMHILQTHQFAPRGWISKAWLRLHAFTDIHEPAQYAQILTQLSIASQTSVTDQATVVHRHWPHLKHGPLGAAIFPAHVRLGMAVTLRLQIEHSIHSLIICCLCLFSTT